MLGYPFSQKAVQAQIDALQQAREEDKGSRRDVIEAFALGFCAACLVFLLLVALAALCLWAGVGVVLAVRGFSWEARRS